MKRLLKYYSLLLLMLPGITAADAQQKKQVVKKHIAAQKNKPVQDNKTASAPNDDTEKWLYSDSLQFFAEDSMAQVKDSLFYEDELKKSSDEFFKTYNAYHYPKDSLSYVDSITANWIKTNTSISADSASDLISKKFTTGLQKARAIFYWIASTIQYDYYSFSNNLVQPIFDHDADAVYTFKNKKGVCQNYSNLYQYMCKKAGLECKIIHGWGKNFPICITGNTDKNTNHAWNAVKTNKGWILLDATWATIDTTGKVDAYWFNTPPEEFIYNHFPEDSSFQLLKSKMSKDQFAKYPIVSETLFKSKFDFEVPETGTFSIANNKFSISVSETDKEYAVAYQLMPFKGTDWQQYLQNMELINLESTIIHNKKNKSDDYEVTIPSKGVWWLAVSINKKIKNKYVDIVPFSEAIIFKIIYQ